MSAVLVIAEHDNQQLAASTLSVLCAAQKISNNVQVLLAGYQCQAVFEQLCGCSGVNKVLMVDHKDYQHPRAEFLTELLMPLQNQFTHFLAPATTFGKNFLPRLAALFDVQAVADVIEVVADDTFVRPIYAGNALAKVQSTDKIKVLSIRPTAFEPIKVEEEVDSGKNVEKVDLQPVVPSPLTVEFVKNELTQLDRPPLADAKIIVSGGRGFQRAENFKLLEALADCLNAAVGASRAAVDAGFVPNDCQVGQTGKVVAPLLYIAIGISGAIQHVAGMKDSKVIVAINKDGDAPIFEIADYGLVADLFDVLPQLTEELGKLRGLK